MIKIDDDDCREWKTFLLYFKATDVHSIHVEQGRKHTEKKLNKKVIRKNAHERVNELFPWRNHSVDVGIVQVYRILK